MSKTKKKPSAHGLGDKQLTIRNLNPTNGTKIHEFMKEGKYVDVKLEFDDGRQIPCHRCVLASCSSYFDCLFSNGMRESHEDVIHIGDVCSSVMTKALEFVYAGQCLFSNNDFFALSVTRFNSGSTFIIRHSNFFPTLYLLKSALTMISLINPIGIKPTTDCAPSFTVTP